jgi:DNA-binding MarR family transcriptional regulator
MAARRNRTVRQQPGVEDADARARLLREVEQQWCGLSAALSRFQSKSAARRGLTLSDLQAVEILAREDGVCASELADECGLTRGAITGMLDRLERAGVARRSRDRGDARRLVIQAKAPRAGADCRLPSGLHAIAASFSEAELHAICRFLAESADALSREAEALPPKRAHPHRTRDVRRRP